MLLLSSVLFFVHGMLQAQNSRDTTTAPEILQKIHTVHLAVAPKPIVDTAALRAQYAVHLFRMDSLFAPGNHTEDIAIRIENTRPHQNNLLLPLFMLFIVVYATWIRYQYYKELRENFIVITNLKLAHQIYRDREYSLTIFVLLTFLNVTLVCGTLLYLLALHFQWQLPFGIPAADLGICIGILLAAYIMKGIVYRFIAYAFRLGAVIYFFRFNALVLYQMTGLLLIPFVLLAAFAPGPSGTWALFAALGVIAIVLLLRIYKGFAILGSMPRFHMLYFLLYICALEIGPLLIIIRLFSMWT